MKYRITTDFAPLTLIVKVTTPKAEKLHIRVYDATNPERKFTERWKTITGEETFHIRMPLSPEIAVVEVYSDKLGASVKKADEKTFGIASVTKEALERRIDLGDIGNGQIRNFVDFAQKFCFNADKLETNTTYQSDDGNYFINYVQTIVGSNGQEMTTPARIGRKSGMIQVSKKCFDKFTIPMRMAILLHEFSHFYLNEKIDDEMEADLNGLLIYLGLGYPRIEAYQAFLETFKDKPTQQNKARYDLINKFINDFEKTNFVIQ
jgi:hypothetical protein